jgi:hypothetical protein
MTIVGTVREVYPEGGIVNLIVDCEDGKVGQVVFDHRQFQPIAESEGVIVGRGVRVEGGLGEQTLQFTD